MTALLQYYNNTVLRHRSTTVLHFYRTSLIIQYYTVLHCTTLVLYCTVLYSTRWGPWPWPGIAVSTGSVHSPLLNEILPKCGSVIQASDLGACPAGQSATNTWVNARSPISWHFFFLPFLDTFFSSHFLTLFFPPISKHFWNDFLQFLGTFGRLFSLVPDTFGRTDAQTVWKWTFSPVYRPDRS